MQRKTAADYLDDINFEDRATDCKDYDGNRDYDKASNLKKNTEQAMQFYASQESEAMAVGFDLWKIDSNILRSKEHPKLYIYGEAYLTSSELFQLYLQHLQSLKNKDNE